MAKCRDLKNYSDDELLALNHQIIAILKARSSRTKDKQLGGLAAGQHVSFLGPEGNLIKGSILRLNKKSVTIATDHGTWRIDPSFIQREKVKKGGAGNVIKMQPRQ